MQKRYTLKEAASIAISSARLYKKNFVGKNLLFILTNKHKQVSYLEVGFDASNFKHLTGLELLDKRKTAKDFFNLCVKGRLSPKDIGFATDGSTHQKLSVLPSVFEKTDLSAKMVGDYDNLHPVLYTEKLVGGIHWAIGVRDVSGKGDFVPDTLLKGDIRNSISTSYRVIATYVKNTRDERYKNNIYTASKIDFDKLKYPKNWGDLPRVSKRNE